MNISLDQIRKFCRKNSLQTKSPIAVLCCSPRQQSSHQPPIRNLLVDKAVHDQIFILIHIKKKIQIKKEDKVELIIKTEGKQTVILFKDKVVLRDYQKIEIEGLKREPLLLVLTYCNLTGKSAIKITCSIKTNYGLDIGKVKTFSSHQQVEKMITEITRKEQNSKLQARWIDLNQLLLKRKELRRYSGNRFLEARKIRSFNSKRSSHNSTNHTTNIPQQKKSIKRIMQQLKTLELPKYSRRCFVQRPQNCSQLIGKKRRDYSILYNSLKNTIPIDLFAVVGQQNPRSKEDIDKIYEQEKKRFDVMDMIGDDSHAIQEEIASRFERYSDSEQERSFCEKENKQNNESSVLAVSEYM